MPQLAFVVAEATNMAMTFFASSLLELTADILFARSHCAYESRLNPALRARGIHAFLPNHAALHAQSLRHCLAHAVLHMQAHLRRAASARAADKMPPWDVMWEKLIDEDVRVQHPFAAMQCSYTQ